MQNFITQVRLDAALEHLNAITRMVKNFAEDLGVDTEALHDGRLDHVARVRRYLTEIAREHEL